MTDTYDTIVQGSEIRRTGAGVALQIAHSHPELEFDLIVAGKGTLFVENGHYDLTPGTLVWLLPNQSHRLMRSPDLDMWVGTYSAERCDSNLLDTVARHPVRLLARDDAIALDRLMSHVAQDSDEPQLYRAGLDYVVRSARHLSETSPELAQAPLHPAVLTALKQLRLHADLPNIGALAKKCGVSQNYLGQLLLQQTNRSFTDWRNRTRLERFHNVYPESGDLLTAALAAGFGSYNQFHRVFVDLVGTTPGQWVKVERAEAIRLPSISAMPDSADRGSARTIWYRLTELVLPDARRWIGQDFAASLLSAARVVDAPAFESCVQGIGDLRRFEREFVDEVEQTDPSMARLLGRAFNGNDVFASIGNAVQQLHFSISDMGGILGNYLTIAWIASNLTVVPRFDRQGVLASAIRNALAASGSFDTATAVERRKAAAAFLAQAFFIRSALVAANASGDEAVLSRVSETAYKNALSTLGLDLRVQRHLIDGGIR